MGLNYLRPLLFHAFLLIPSVLLAGCGHFQKFQTPYLNPNPLLTGTRDTDPGDKNGPGLRAQGIAFSKAYAEAKRTGAQQDLKKFLESGMAYADLECTYYFTRLDYTHAQRDFAQKETTLVGGLTTALLGLADAGSAVTGGAGAAFGFTSSSFDTYNSAFLASDDVGLLQQLVSSVQNNDKIEILRRVTNSDSGASWPDRIDTLDLAVSDLNVYISRCTPIGIRNLLKESIANKTTNEVRKAQGEGGEASPDEPPLQ